MPTSSKVFYFLILILLSYNGLSQIDKKPLSYYLPDITYDEKIPTPEQYLGYQIGDWHVTHDQLVAYFKVLDMLSDRIEIAEYARSHENRPLIVAMISSPENLKNKDNIKKQHSALANSDTAGSVNISNLPAVLWQGYTIHGNEPSGNNASLLVAYYLAAGQSQEVKNILNNTVILMDPCLNPDGSQRFSTWVNSHKSQHLVSDPSSREFSEVWPGGRYNHYWFDMNRDWLLLVHPESRGRIQLFHEWHPNVLTDHHEMGTNSTFFFQPGIPSSNNPNTPSENFILTEEIGKYHAKALDSIGSLYFTKASFDDFYYGKGSTYPDALGCIGILFEQASSRGHLQESVNGPVSFPFTIRNQVNTSLSTQRAVLGLKERLLTYKQTFHKKVLEKISSIPIKGYIFADRDEAKIQHFLNILLQHKVDVYKNEQNLQINENKFEKGKSYIVPLAQAQPILAKTIFEVVQSFQDSSFYDVSGWTLSHAFGLKCEPLTTISVNRNLKVTSPLQISGGVTGDTKEIYSFIIEPEQRHIHKTVYELQKLELIVRIAQSDMEVKIGNSVKVFSKGSIIIPVQNQSVKASDIIGIMNEIGKRNDIIIHPMAGGNGTNTITVGHPLVSPLEKPEIAYIVGSGINPQSAGEIWHHLDLNLRLPATMLEHTRFRSTNLKRYNTIILPEGSYNTWGESEINKLRDWCQQGNTLITIGSATEWAADKKLVVLNQRKIDKNNSESGKYENADREIDAKVIGGSIFGVDADLSHPLFYGFDDNKLSLMKTGTKFYEPTNNKYASPAKYRDDFLVSGYLPKGISSSIRKGAAITVHGIGAGKVICFQDNPLFRGYWLVGQKIFNNALFYSKVIDRRTIESGE